ncbi:MAG: hypothetical protein LKJ45_07525, partial [Oscillospiraceae bacterium]|nr:hypothetical protein [Oscillospiraceae bacterium]
DLPNLMECIFYQYFQNNNSEVILLKKTLMLLISTAALITVLLLIQLPVKQRTASPASSSEKSTSYYFSSNDTLSQESSSTVKANAKTRDSYTIKTYHGHIGVFKNKQTEPFREYNTEIDVLPEQDQQDLAAGIVVYSMEEVEKRIEDYDA